MLRSKFFKFLLSILKRQADSSPNFVSLFSVMKDNSSVLFHLKLYMLSTKGTHQVQIFRLSAAHIKINQIPHVNFEKTSQFLFKFCITLQCHERYLLYTFLAPTTYTLFKSSPLKENFLRLPSAVVKISHIPHVIFQTTSQFFFKFYITLQCHEK